MREWIHDELHRIMDSTPRLKELSDSVHSLPKARTWEDAIDQKKRMMVIYALAINCQRATTAERGVEEVFSYFQQQYKTFEAYTSQSSPNPEDGRAIQKISDRYKREGLCHSSLGNNYLCLCPVPQEIKYVDS